jgi:flavin reductase (DIM6/NTAB) family NADH-FMN oxidoreductase RutF
MDISEDLKATVGRALGRIPSGVFVLTAGRGATGVAMLGSWVQQASFAPPAVSVAVAKGRPFAAEVRDRRLFALSIIGETDAALMKKYARGVDPGEDPFAGLNTADTPGGVTYLADALAYLECELLTACDYGGDHELLVARVTAGRLLKDGPSFTHLRGNGFHY